MLNAPIDPLLTLVRGLLTEPTNINVFHSFWAIVISIISMFYGLFFLFAGFNFMISGHDAARRAKAKEWLRNTILMVLFVQGSFFIYAVVIELSSLLTAGVMGIIDPNFFRFTVDSLPSFGLQIALLVPYVIVLVLTILILGLRYLIVIIGVVLFPIAIFFYFIPPLQSYGKMMLNILLILIFIPFFDAIVLFGASALLSIALFANFKIVVATVAFLAVCLLMLILMVFAVVKAAFAVINSDIGRNVKAAVKYII